MFKTSIELQKIKDFALTLLGLLILGLLLADLLHGGSALAQTADHAPETQSISAQPGNPNDIFASCMPQSIATSKNLVRVRCQWPTGGISQFAAPTSDAAFSARVLSVITAAQVAGRTLTIEYNPDDLGGSAIGCQNSDCRLIVSAGFGQ